MKRTFVTVQIPGSTSNLGSGFDTLGLALNVYAIVQVRPRNGAGLALASAIDSADRGAIESMLAEAATAFFQAANAKAFRIEVRLGGDLPAGRGLGASAAARLGIIAGLNEITAAGLSRDQLLALVARLEHHPDNASPAVRGGFTVSGFAGDEVRCLNFPVSARLKCVTLIPNFAISTVESRKLIPRRYSKEDTVHSLNRAALITAAFAAQDYEALRGVFDDRVHQPARERLLPQLSRVIAAGERAGAIGGFLSGSGSGMICLTLKNATAVAQAMQQELPDSKVRILAADHAGFTILKAKATT
ncbi:MAG: homoserine kinase [Verrucomicrobiota bacterium]